MRRSIGLLVVVLLTVSVTACSDAFWDPWKISFHLAGPGGFTHTQEDAAISFTAIGPPVDSGVVCEGGVVTMDHIESADGETIAYEDWADMFDTAMENDGVAEMYAFQDFECEDGSGGFSMKVHNTFDFAHFEFEGEQDVGFWEIEEGTGSYSELSGKGGVTLDWDNEYVKYGGEAH